MRIQALLALASVIYAAEYALNDADTLSALRTNVYKARNEAETAINEIDELNFAPLVFANAKDGLRSAEKTLSDVALILQSRSRQGYEVSDDDLITLGNIVDDCIGEVDEAIVKIVDLINHYSEEPGDGQVHTEEEA
jgi:hypothetical protein